MRALACFVSGVVFVAGSVSAEPASKLAMSALVQVCLADDTVPTDQVASKQGWSRVATGDQWKDKLTAWDKSADNGHVTILNVPGTSLERGPVCNVIVHGDAGKLLDQSREFLYDVGFTSWPKGKDGDITIVWHLEKMNFDGHRFWTVLGGNRINRVTGFPGARHDDSENYTFVQVSRFRAQ